jgi:hypothetical protein
MARLRRPPHLLALLLSGAALAAAPATAQALKASDVNYGVRGVGGTYKLIESVLNDGSLPANILGLFPGDPELTVSEDNCTGMSLAYNTSCTFGLNWTPTTARSLNSHLDLAYKSGSSPATAQFAVTGTAVAQTQPSPTALTTTLTAGTLGSGTNVSAPFGIQVGANTVLSGGGASAAVGTFTYTIYSGTDCEPAGTYTTSVGGGVVGALSPITLIPGITSIGGVYSGDKRNQPATTPCGTNTATVAGPQPSASKEPCAPPKTPTSSKGRILVDVYPRTVAQGQWLHVTFPCSLGHKALKRIESAPPPRASLVHNGAHVTIGPWRLLNKYNGELWVSPWSAGARAVAAAAIVPVANYRFLLNYVAHLFALQFAGRNPVRVVAPPKVNHPTCSGTPPATFLVFPNHSPSPGATSLLLSCTLKSPVKNGFSGGAWTPQAVELYDYASFQNMQVINGRLVHKNTFPVRPPKFLGFKVIGPQDIDVTIPGGLPPAVYIPVVDAGNIQIPASNVLNLP